MKYVFVDMDGVIAEYGYPSGSYDGDFQKGNYVGKKPVGAVIDEIIRKYNNKDHIVMVCSASPNAKATMEKNDWLNNNFGVPYENRLFITPEEDKVEVIRYYIEEVMHGSVQEHAIVIDDKGTTLAKARSLGIECYHPSQILALKKYEEDKAIAEAQQAQAEAEAQMAQEQPVEENVEAPEQPVEECPECVPEEAPETIEEPVIDETTSNDEVVEVELPQDIDGQMSIEDLQKLIDEQNGIVGE